MNSEPNSATPLPSNRSFGLLFSAIFASISGYFLYKSSSSFLVSSFFFAAFIFLAITIISPSLLASLNKTWLNLGILLGRIVNPVVLGAVFFLIITPVAIVMRMAGRDPLRLCKQNVKSFWIDRNPAGPDAQSFKKPF